MFRHALLGISLLAFAVTNVDAAKPLKVYVLIGQSNMQGHARVTTFEHVGMDPKTAPLLSEMQSKDGTPVVCDDVWISYLSTGGTKQGKLTAGFGAADDKIGPEFTFGIYTQKRLGEPILIIKTAWGGKSLNTDFRPPNAGPYEFSKDQLERFESQNKDVEKIKSDKVAATGHYYRLAIDHVKEVLSDISKVYPAYDSISGFELAGCVWFQGWNDMVDRGTYPQRDQPGGYDQYSTVMAQFIRDLRKDLNAPKLPFVIGVLGVGGPVVEYLPEQKRYQGVHENFRSAMAAPAELPEFADNVRAVRTENFWDRELLLLRSREAKIKQKIRALQNEKKLARAEIQKTQDKLRAEEFSEQELKVLRVGVSNAEYHYLGSAKIMAQIGKGFADALAEIESLKN